MIEGRGTWVHIQTCKALGGTRVARECYEHGLNIIHPWVPFMTGPEGYCKDPEYWKTVIDPMISEAHKLGIEVHAWINFLNDASVDNDRSLMQIMETGQLHEYGCPANPETVKRNLEKIDPILSSYDLDGLSLEDCFIYRRFQNEPAMCFCDYCKKHAPTDPEEKKMWNRKQLTNMLREIVKESKKYSSKLKISAAARVPYVSHALAMSADWKEWCDLGLLDYLAPMIYKTDIATVRTIAEETLQLIAPSRVPVYVGLGAYMIDRQWEPYQTFDQIALTRELKAHGQILYHMGAVTVDQWIQVERAYTERASPPYLER